MVTRSAAVETCDRCGHQVSTRRQARSCRPDGESEIRRCARASTAKQVDVGPCELPSHRGGKRLASPRRDRDSNAVIPKSRILLINARSIQQDDITRTAVEISIDGYAALEIRLGCVRQATGGRRRAQREIHRCGRAIAHNHIERGVGSESRKRCGDAGIGAGGNPGERVRAIDRGSGRPAAERHRHALNRGPANGCRYCA